MGLDKICITSFVLSVPRAAENPRAQLVIIISVVTDPADNGDGVFPLRKLHRHLYEQTIIQTCFVRHDTVLPVPGIENDLVGNILGQRFGEGGGGGVGYVKLDQAIGVWDREIGVEVQIVNRVPGQVRGGINYQRVACCGAFVEMSWKEELVALEQFPT